MLTEFRKADPTKEIRSLLAFDRKVFPAADLFERDYWNDVETFWMLIGGVRAGCCAFERDVDFQDDIRQDRTNPRMKGSLYIASTGILPRFQGAGLGSLLKCWQIWYARHHRYHRMVTNTRRRNTPMIALNRKFGFKVIRRTRDYYSGPNDSTVVMELRLTRPSGTS